MKIRSNIHTHTNWSDGRDSMETMVRAAAEKGFHTIGISDHSYTSFDESYCMRRDGETAYRAELQRLREQYAGQIDVLTGIEYEYAGAEPVPEAEYVIGSLHYVQIDGAYYSIDEDVPHFQKLLQAAGGSLELAKRYYDSVAEHTMRVRPDVLGHLDLLTKFSMVEETEAYRDCALEALKAVLPLVRAVEVNTGAMARGYRQSPYPADFLLEAILAAGGAVILSADAHRAEHLDFAFDETLARLRRIGFSRVLERRGGEFVSIPLAE